jgi:hypothetical protein
MFENEINNAANVIERAYRGSEMKQMAWRNES